MKLKELVEIANKVYGDGWNVAQYLENPDGGHGDDLAKFIAIELSETFESDASDQDQLDEAYKVMNTARHSLNAVCHAFQRAIQKPIEELSKKRELSAEKAFSEADLPPVASSGSGWEQDGEYWSRRLLLESEEEDQPSRKGNFGVQFEKGTDKVIDSWTDFG